MNRLNFDKLKSIKTPNEWLENAVNIPNEKKSIPFPFYRHTSFLTSAACVALCMIVGVIIILNAQHGKIPVSDNPITTPSAALQSSIPSDNSEHNWQNSNNHIDGGTTQAVTEPSEITADNSNARNTQSTANSNPKNISPNSNGGKNQATTSDKSGVSATENTRVTQLQPSAGESTSTAATDGRPSIPPERTDPPEPATADPDLVYTNSIYFHVDLNSDFDFSNTVGCHIKDSNGKDLYPYNSSYEKCDFVGESTGGDGVFVEENVCFVYNNKGPHKIIYGLYEVTFYDVNGNTVTRTVNFSGDNSVHIF